MCKESAVDQNIWPLLTCGCYSEVVVRSRLTEIETSLFVKGKTPDTVKLGYNDHGYNDHGYNKLTVIANNFNHLVWFSMF